MNDLEFFTIPCAACNALNRIASTKLEHKAKCGACGVPITPLAVTIHGHESNFSLLVAGSSLPVLVDFWAPWCGPCRALTPIMDKIAREYSGKLKVVKINSDENRQLSQKFLVTSIPTLILFEQGTVKNQFVGAMPLQQMRNWIDRSLGWL